MKQSDSYRVLREKLSKLTQKIRSAKKRLNHFNTIIYLAELKKLAIQKVSKRSQYDYLVVAAVLIYSAIFSWLTISKNYGFATFAWDLGIFNQSFHTTIFNGKLFYYTCELYLNPSGSYFASKFSPILFLVLPFYAIVPSVDALLVFKSFILALGAVPLYLLSKDMIGNEKAGFVMVLAYLLYPGIQFPNTFDFQQQIFIPVTIFSAYYFMLKKRWKTYFLFVTLALMIEEHVAVILLLMSFFILLTTSRVKTAVQEIKKRHFSKPSKLSSILLGTMVFSTSWYFIARLVRSVYPIVPAFTEIYNATANYSVLGFTNDILALPTYIIMNPQRVYNALAYDFHLKFLYLIFLFAPLAFLSFRSKLSLAVAVLLVPFFLSNYEPYYTLGAHYPLYLLPLIFLGAVEGLSSPKKEMKTASATHIRNVTPALRTVLIVSLIIAIAISPLSPLSQVFAKEGLTWYAQPNPNTHYVNTIHEIMNLVPQNASILTQNNIFPHFSDRINAYVIPTVQVESNSALTAMKRYIRQEINLSDYVLLDGTGLGTEPWTSFVLDELNTTNDFKIYALGESAILFMKNYSGLSFFVPDNDYEVFFGNSDFLVPYARIVNDPTSNSGNVVYSQKEAGNNVVLYGPYVFLPPGTFDVTFEVKVGEHQEGYLGTIDVSENFGTSILSKEDIYGFNIPANTWTNYTLSLTTTKLRRAVEFRVFTSGLADIYLDRVIVKRTSQLADADFGTITLSQKDLNLGTGEFNDEGFIVNRHGVSDTFVWYGPYVTLPPGTYKATYFIKASSPLSSRNQKVLTIDAVSLLGSHGLAGKTLYSFDLFDDENVSRWHSFTLTFTSDHVLTDVEFRGLNPSPDVDIYLGFILIERIT
jgi:uncharacterized membrane protein